MGFYARWEGGNLGPVAPEAIANGVRDGLVPRAAWVAEDGAGQWVPLDSHPVIVRALAAAMPHRVAPDLAPAGSPASPSPDSSTPSSDVDAARAEAEARQRHIEELAGRKSKDDGGLTFGEWVFLLVVLVGVLAGAAAITHYALGWSWLASGLAAPLSAIVIGILFYLAGVLGIFD